MLLQGQVRRCTHGAVGSVLRQVRDYQGFHCSPNNSFKPRTFNGPEKYPRARNSELRNYSKILVPGPDSELGYISGFPRYRNNFRVPTQNLEKFRVLILNPETFQSTENFQVGTRNLELFWKPQVGLRAAEVYFLSNPVYPIPSLLV